MNFTNFTRGQADLGGATSLGFGQGIVDGILLRRQMDMQDKEMKLKEKHENDWAKVNEDKMILANLKASIDQQKAEAQAQLAEEKLKLAQGERDFATAVLPMMMQYENTGNLDPNSLPSGTAVPTSKAAYGFADAIRKIREGKGKQKVNEQNAISNSRRAGATEMNAITNRQALPIRQQSADAQMINAQANAERTPSMIEKNKATANKATKTNDPEWYKKYQAAQNSWSNTNPQKLQEYKDKWSNEETPLDEARAESARKGVYITEEPNPEYDPDAVFMKGSKTKRAFHKIKEATDPQGNRVFYIEKTDPATGKVFRAKIDETWIK